MKWFLAGFLVLVNLVFQSVFCCPSDVCVCKWKNGKQTVECGGKFLPSLPDGMDAGTQVLNFTGNSLQVLHSERFLKMDLINLQKIFLSRNQIIRIHDRTFKGLSNLVELDFSDNMLTSVPTETFQDYSSLMRLSLSGNPIRELKTSAFKHLSFLTTLELSNCQIDRIEDEAFIGMDNLEWLRLDGNQITTIRGNHILPDSLHGINLQGNRWNCDCRLLDLHVWLVTFNVPQTEEPKCMGPERLAGQAIKSVQMDDLACLPDINPTTLFLEIAEGRNISLLCKITAVPEATISWWFQGQVLQNDSLFVPNYHLYYYVEEGIEEKRSELYIYNTNIEDNGTFACVAENPAGRVQANYTIRVILKEEPIVEQVTFPYEYFLIIIAGTGCMGVIFLIICCILIVKCRRRSKRRTKKKSSSKEALQQQSNPIKCSSIATESNDQIIGPKLNGSITISDHNQQEMMLYVTNTAQNTGCNESAATIAASQYCSPPSARNFQEQNPDLINDAESVNKSRMRSDADTECAERGSSGPSSIQESIHAGSEISFDQKMGGQQVMRQMPARFVAMSTLPRGMNRELYHQHQADVHLNPGCFLATDNGYPVDYGQIAKMTMIPQVIPSPDNSQINFYRTLPHNRGVKIHSAANPGMRYSREAEFLSRTTPLQYEAFAPTDVRYTAQGYPCNQQAIQMGDPNFPSPPDGYKNDTHQPVALINSPSCCASPVPQQWPAYLPGYHSQIVPIKTVGNELLRYPSPQPTMMSPASTPTTVTKRCVGAQTSDPEKESIPEQQEEEDEETQNDERENAGESKTRQLTGPLADSPDEGYVGDSQDGSDM